MEQILNSWFVSVALKNSLDIILLAFIIYKCYQILVQTRAIQLLKGALLLLGIYVITFTLNLRTLSWILQFIAPYLFVFLVIIFQPELRKIFTKIGQDRWLRFSPLPKNYNFEPIFNSLEMLAGKRCGSLIVIKRNVGLKNIIETGTWLDASLSTSLILTVFDENTPLHDGAIVVREDKILAAGCFLPLSEQTDIRRSFGTRHRAALGLAEETDAVVIVVSEETGAISLAYDANLLYDLSIEEISRRIKQLFEYSEDSEGDQEEDSSLEV